MNRIVELVKILKVPFIINEVKEDDDILIITDTAMDERIVEGMVAALHELGAEPTVTTMMPRSRHSMNPTKPIMEAMMASKITVLLTGKTSLAQSEAALRAIKNNVKLLCMETVTLDMLLNAGDVQDYERMLERGFRIKEVMDNADTVRVTTPAGTDFTASINGRTAYVCAGKIFPQCEFLLSAAFPDGNDGIPLVEGTAEGTVVFDTTMRNIGLIDTPMVATVRKGRIVNFEGGSEVDTIQRLIKDHGDELAYDLTYLGLGFNENLPLTGVMRSDKKRYGHTILAIGNNYGVGGKNKSKQHIDAAIRNATITFGDTVVMRDGEVLI